MTAKDQVPPHQHVVVVRPRIATAESILGRPWAGMAERHGDWGRDGTLAVATRHLGWSLVEGVRMVPGFRYAAAAQATCRFWKQTENHAERVGFVRRLKRKCQLKRFDPIASSVGSGPA